MSSRRRAVPKIDRQVQASTELNTFFEIMIPPGVSSSDTHAYLAAHLGESMATKIEGNTHWDVDDNRAWQ